MVKDCPTSLQEQHKEDIKTLYERSLPAWTRAILVGLIGTLFVFCGWLYAYGASTYATKEEVKEMRVETRQDMKEINAKLDALLQRKP